jgi:flagellin-specific chaperone FliS
MEIFIKLEKKIRCIELMNETRECVLNFIESYYYDKNRVNEIINKLKDSINVNKNNHLTNITEFYNFCKIYTEDAETDEDIKNKDDIIKILHNNKGLDKIQKAINIIKNIEKIYYK